MSVFHSVLGQRGLHKYVEVLTFHFPCLFGLWIRSQQLKVKRRRQYVDTAVRSQPSNWTLFRTRYCAISYPDPWKSYAHARWNALYLFIHTFVYFYLFIYTLTFAHFTNTKHQLLGWRTCLKLLLSQPCAKWENQMRAKRHRMITVRPAVHVGLAAGPFFEKIICLEEALLQRRPRSLSLEYISSGVSPKCYEARHRPIRP